MAKPRRGRPRKRKADQAHSLTVRLYADDRARVDLLKTRWALTTDSDVLRKALSECVYTAHQ